MQYITGGRLERGKLTIRDRQHMIDTLKSWRDCECVITIERAHATRSLAQNDFYHAVVVARVAHFWKRDVKESHEILKATFLPHDLAADGKNGVLLNGYVIGGSTAKLNRLQFIEYLEAIVMHFAERGLVIPDPDPNWRAAAEGASNAA